MKIRELIEALERVEERNSNDNVVIERSDPSIGAAASSDIKSLNVGFDWDRGKVFLVPEKQLYRSSDQETIQKLRKALDGALWEHHNLREQLKKNGIKPVVGPFKF